MHAAELMARLNPSTVRYDVGRGGIPELTTQDIAAAVAMVPAGLGRDLMCFIYWPDQVGIKAKEMDRKLLDVQLAEWTRRELAMYKALGAIACEDLTNNRAALTRQYAEANARRWPKLRNGVDSTDIVKPWELMRTAVMAEVTHPKQCSDCGGQGDLVGRDGVKPCSRCIGAGTIARGTSWRAERLKMKESSFCQRWAAPYEWLLGHITEELANASRQLKRAVRGEGGEPPKN